MTKTSSKKVVKNTNRCVARASRTARLEDAETASIASLKKLSAENRDKYDKSVQTRRNYESCLKRGKAFLAKCVAARRGEAAGHEPDEINTALLAVAFDKPPNRHSVDALEMFITAKCVKENCTKSTAMMIHSAFKWYWSRMDGDVYAGEYSCDGEAGIVRGCPALSDSIHELLQSIKTRDCATGASAMRGHAEAMSLEDLTRIMEWSRTVCPESWSPPGATPVPDTEEKYQWVSKHLFMRAYMSTAFTLWTRNSELCKLRKSHVQEQILHNGHNLPYFTVTLENRKGWQKKVGYEGQLIGQTYKIYKQDIWAMDMYTHLQAWMRCLKATLAGWDDENKDCIFLSLNPNGVHHPHVETSMKKIQSWIDEFTQGAGLAKEYTTHSFRRGGAQYRFMHAPLGKRWSLSIVRWWGGWAEGENVETLMKYLMDSLQSYETGHSDALCPIQNKADRSFMGEHQMLEPVSRAEFHSLTSTLVSTIRQEIAVVQVPPSTVVVSTTPATSSFSSSIQDPPVAGIQAVPLEANRTSLALSARRSHRRQVSATGPPVFPVRPVPRPGIFIKDIKPGPRAWLEAVQQWDEGDPEGRMKPLKEWEPADYQGVMRTKVAAKRQVRELIAREYCKFDRVPDDFEAAYPQARRGIKALLDEIRRRNNRQRKSRNGTPEERNRRANETHQGGSGDGNDE